MSGDARSRRGWRAALAAPAALALIALGGCGNDDGDTDGGSPEAVAPTRTEVVVQSAGGRFNPAEVYERAAPGVVTVISLFDDSGSILDTGGAGQGSGFVVSDEGEIVTNAHVVTNGGAGNGGGKPEAADQVFVEFADRNRVRAEILGYDSDADIALIKVDPGEIELEPLQLSQRDTFAVGEPVAAIGSPFGERQSLSVGVISAIDRTVQSLTQFSIDDAIQTDASINPGNSGGPLLDADGNVIGINQQIETSSGSNSGVGFAIPVTALHYSLEQLRDDGEVEYAYLGVTTQGLWPQLAAELGLDTDTGALISEVVDGGPADDAGLEGSNDQRTFQGTRIQTGGDVIIAVEGTRLLGESDLAELISRRRPGDTVTILILRDGDREEIEVELEPRPENPTAG